MIKDYITKSAFAALMVYSAIYLLAFTLSRLSGSIYFITSSIELFLYTAAFLLIWAIMAVYVAKSDMEGSAFIRFMYMLNKNLQLGIVDIALYVVAFTALKMGGALPAIFDFFPMIICTFLATLANMVNAEGGAPWTVLTTTYPKDGGGEQDHEDDCVKESEKVEYESGEKKSMNYTWMLDPSRGKKLRGNITLQFDSGFIHALRRQNPFYGSSVSYSSIESCIHFMIQYQLSHPETLANLFKIVNYINRMCSREALYEYDRLQFVLDFVQEPCIKYIHDDECQEIGNPAEYFRFPEETLYDQRGDCDCKSMLACMLFYLMGYKVMFLISTKLEHAAICIEYDNRWAKQIPPAYMNGKAITNIDGKQYIYCETTGDGFRIGSISPSRSIDDFEMCIPFEA